MPIEVEIIYLNNVGNVTNKLNDVKKNLEVILNILYLTLSHRRGFNSVGGGFK